AIAVAQVHHRHAARIATLARYILNLRAQDDAVGGDTGDFVVARNHARAHDATRKLADGHRAHALAIARLAPEFAQSHALAVTILGDQQQVAVRLHHIHAGDDVALFQAHGVDACRRAAHGANLFLGEADG